jgi:flagellar biosynthesis/type III secretory pathway protein FliH
MSPGNEICVGFHSPLAAVVFADPRAPLPATDPPVVRSETSAKPTLPPADSSPPVDSELVLRKGRETEVRRRLEEEQAAIRSVLDGVTAAARRVEEEHRGRLADWRKSAVELAVTIATRLVHDRVKADDFAIETVVREAAALLGPRGPFTVRLHPADLTLLESRLGGAPLLIDGTGMLVVTADPSQSRGDCRVEASDAAVTSRLGDQLAAVRRELLRSLGDAEPGP